MNFHDSVLDGFELDAQRHLHVRFSEVKGQPVRSRVVFVVDDYQLLISDGKFESDWFLSGVFCVDNYGVKRDLKIGDAFELGRLVVLGDNGAFLEVIGGNVRLETQTEGGSG